MASARIVAYAGSSAPSGWLACQGQSLLRADEPELFSALGTTYGAADGSHFNLPDLRARFALGKSASGTGSTLGESGGALGHQHVATHGHSVTQPDAHSAHAVTQPTAHSSLPHAGLAATDHPATSHAGITVAAHNVTKTSAHGSHDSAGSHDHDAHSYATFRSTGSSGRDSPQGRHNADGGHTHDAHSAHDETVNGHSITSQGANHGLQAHSVTQANAHSLAAHAFTVDAHSAHSNAAAASASVTLAAADPPYFALIFIAAPATTPMPAGAVIEFGADAAPTAHLACDGQSLLRSSYPDLFAAVGTAFGAADGTHFSLPDLRGRLLIGAGTGAAFGSTGGAANHTHAGASHGHLVTQPDAHGDHIVGQPSHPSLAHAGAAMTAHSMGHSGFAVADHNVGQSSGHGTHNSGGGHTHNAHSGATFAAGLDMLGGPNTHNSEGSHTHNAHSSHAGADLSSHSETQANTHNATHAVTQPDDHPSQGHAGATLDPHGAHTAAAVTAAALASSAGAEAPYLALRYVIRTSLGTQPIGGIYRVGQAAAPTGTVLCQGQTVSRAAYPNLWSLYGTTFGAGDGSTTFGLPDLRGRIPRGANGDLAASGGALDHTHAVSATHGHSTTQPDAHAAHVATQPGDHGGLTHANAAVATHALSHGGADISNHSASQANAHSAHSSAGDHNHDTHTSGGLDGTVGAFKTALYAPLGTHNTEGSHTHSGAHGHSGFGVNAHNVGQPDAHSLAHSVTQPDAHSISAHVSFGVNAHSAHAGFAVVAGGTGTTDAANPPYLVVNYVVQALDDVFSLESSIELAIGAPEFHVTDYDMELNDVPTTPPSSPTIFVLEPPE